MKILIDHIKKTAGTSVGDFFRNAIGSERVTPIILDENIEISENLFDNHDIVIGHFNLNQNYPWRKNIYHTTILRNPVERFLSHYSYVRGQEDAQEPFAILAKRHSIPELIEMNDINFIESCGDFYCRHFLYALYHEGEDVLSKEIDLKIINDFIDQHYQFIGITEHLKLTLGIICLDNSIRADITDIRSRVTPERLSVDSLDRSVRRRLEELMENDIRLYQTFYGKFFQRLEGVAQMSLYRLPAGQRTAHFSAPQPVMSDASMDFVGAQLVCPDRPRNDIGVAAKACWLVTKFHVRNFPPLGTISIVIRNSLKQVMFRQDRNFAVSETPDMFIEFLWQFTCWLGEDTYGVTIQIREREGDVPGRLLFSFQNFYQFMIKIGELQNSAGLCHLAPAFRITEMATAHSTVVGSLTAPTEGFTVRPGETLAVPVRLKNEGTEAWPVAGYNYVAAGYWIEDENGNTIGEGRRTILDHSLEPGEERETSLWVDAPVEEGNWRLRPALVHEHVSWFFRCETTVPLTVVTEGREGAVT